MTVSSEQSRVQYATDGVATSFPVPFRFLRNQDLRVTLVQGDGSEQHLSLDADYTVTGAGQQSGGTLTTTDIFTPGHTLLIDRIVAITQETAYQRNDPFPERAHERALDKLTMICQMLASIFGLTPGSVRRALLLGEADQDGQGAYRANGNRIQGLGKPRFTTDAARLSDILDAVSQLSADGSGQFVVERLNDYMDPGNGPGMIGFKDELDQVWRLSSLLKQYGPTYIQFGAIRQAVQGGGWRFISDTDHRPRGFSGQPTVDGNGDIIIYFDRGFPKVGGLLVCPDETLALFGITVGASVGLDFAAISMSKDMSLLVNLGDKTIDAETYFRPRVSMSENSDGTFTVTHPPVPSGFEAPVMSPSFVGNVDARIVDFTSTTITIAPTVPLNGSVVFDGSSWNVVTAAKVKPTVSFKAGVLTVTHQPISAAQEKFALISPRKPNVPISISSGTQSGLDSFSVEFRDPSTGGLLSSVPSGAGFFYRRDIDVIAEQGAGSFAIKRGSVKLNAEDVFLENANLWILGMQIVEP